MHELGPNELTQGAGYVQVGTLAEMEKKKVLRKLKCICKIKGRFLMIFYKNGMSGSYTVMNGLRDALLAGKILQKIKKHKPIV